MFKKYFTRYVGVIVAGILAIAVGLTFTNWFNYNINLTFEGEVYDILMDFTGVQCAYGESMTLNDGTVFTIIESCSVLLLQNIVVYVCIAAVIVFFFLWVFNPEREVKFAIKILFSVVGFLLVACGVLAFLTTPLVIHFDPDYAPIIASDYTTSVFIGGGAIAAGILEIVAGLVCFVPLLNWDPEYR